MKGLIATWRAMLPHARRSAGQQRPNQLDESSVRDERDVARGLADTIERAMSLGLWEHAHRVAESATPLAHRYPHLADRLARLRLAQRDAESALSIIDSCAVRPASLRLLRAACLLQLGQRIEAQLDLREWSRRASAPLQARYMLALLEWDAGDPHAAMEALRRNLRQIEDPRSLAALVLISAALRRRDPAAIWADRLRNASQWSTASPDIDLLLQSLDLAAHAPTRTTTSPDRIAMLAAELQANESVIPALTAAQRIEPKPQTAMLVASAIESALPDLENQDAARQALAQLRVAAGEPDGAHSMEHADEPRDVLAKIGDTVQEVAA